MIEDRTSRHRKRGFTRVDLLLVLAMALLLVVIALPALASTKSSSQAAVCRNNLRRLIQAWNMYANNNEGRLVPNFGPNAFGNQTGPTWSDGWTGITSGPGFSGIGPDSRKLVYPEITGGQTGLLGPYLKRNATVFKCPADSRKITIFGHLVSPIRSVAMNNWMGGQAFGLESFKIFEAINDITVPEPANALVFVENQDFVMFGGAFIIDMVRTLVDYPAARHDGGANLAFADGHVALRVWQDPRTITIPTLAPGSLLPLNEFMTNNADLEFLRSVATTAK
ncbi:hypothetical protein GC207_11970 [bacterium]|nr:hypothetical protein [bacterium]